MTQEIKTKIEALLDAAKIQCDEMCALRDNHIIALNARIKELESLLQLQPQ